MAYLVKCSLCGRNVSNESNACPGCGHNIAEELRKKQQQQDMQAREKLQETWKKEGLCHYCGSNEFESFSMYNGRTVRIKCLKCAFTVNYADDRYPKYSCNLSNKSGTSQTLTEEEYNKYFFRTKPKEI